MTSEFNRARGRNFSPNNGDRLPLLSDSDEEAESVVLTLPPSDEKSDKKRADYETAIAKTGFGRFHYWLLFVCGWANASDAIEILCISFVLPSATCDLSLSSEDKGWLSAITFIGMLVGGYTWGSLGDQFGRRKTLMVAMIVNAIFGIGSSFSQIKATFFVCRFFSGLGVGGSIPLVWSYFAEFQCKERRGRMLSALATFWMIGNITVAGIAWAIIPFDDIGLNPQEGFKFNSWRIFVAVCGIPAFLVTIALAFLPESPKYLISKGKEVEALKVFRQVYMQNTGHYSTDYPVSYVKVDRHAGSSTNESSLNEIVSNTIILFKSPLLWVTMMMLFINFSIQFGYYGLWLWFPELFNKLNLYQIDHPNESKSVCEITDYKPQNSTASEECIPSGDVFFNSFLISISALPGNVWTMVHMDKLGRKFFLVFSMLMSGACVFFIYLVKSEAANLALSCAFGFVSTMGFNSLDCLGIELFPTNVRSTAMAVTLAVARLGAILGNVIFGYFIELSCAVPILMVAVLLISGGLLSIRLPSTSRTALA